MGSLTLRPGGSLTIPKMALSISFTGFVSSTDVIQATGLLTLAPVGLAPTEHASLCWTHCSAKSPYWRLRADSAADQGNMGMICGGEGAGKSWRRYTLSEYGARVLGQREWGLTGGGPPSD